MSTEFELEASRTPWHLLARRASRFLFPSRCLCCGQAEPESLQGGVCATCWTQAAIPASPRCDRCGQRVASDEPGRCGRCLLFPPEFRALQALTSYCGAARAILLAFKFRGADYLAPHLARRMAEGLEVPDKIDEVVPVPAVRRQRLRRDHAADLLAAAVASELAAPLSADRVMKVRTTLRQSSLPLARRAENVRGAFRARRPVPRRILLVDDVATSCSTAKACARELLRGGAVTVDVWCYARATREDELAAGD
ncbi:MAG TPA: double zinc ribbon domain-containing protein [Thermoanaerobaculia bacterium]|nr:double zinc ribbon domain-containing protein [Thermoanaerobaculia bacterium]